MCIAVVPESCPLLSRRNAGGCRLRYVSDWVGFDPLRPCGWASGRAPRRDILHIQFDISALIIAEHTSSRLAPDRSPSTCGDERYDRGTPTPGRTHSLTPAKSASSGDTPRPRRAKRELVPKCQKVVTRSTALRRRMMWGLMPLRFPLGRVKEAGL